MNKNTPLFTEEQMDFVREMMNVGAGNAVTALHQLLKCPVDLTIPRVHVLEVNELPQVLGTPDLIVACAATKMVGDIEGAIFFIVPADNLNNLKDLIKKGQPGFNLFQKQKPGDENSAFIETANILCGVYLTAIHDFCKLNIHYTTPVFAVDMLQALLDEALVAASLQIQMAILVENEFEIDRQKIKTNFIVIPSIASRKPLIEAFGRAKKAYESM
jgi:chemotaxis protein CheC